MGILRYFGLQRAQPGPAGLRGGHMTYMKYVHRDADGAVLFESGWEPNNLANEGEKNILNSYLRNTENPTGFFIRLFGSTPQENFSLASLTVEPGGTIGYAPKPVNRDASAAGWPVLDDQASGGDFQAESAMVSFRATGSWPTVTHAILATSSDNTGKLVDYTALKQPRSLRSGQQLDIIYVPRLS